jgi:hypothetical protein
VTPAIEAGITDHVWELAEFLAWDTTVRKPSPWWRRSLNPARLPGVLGMRGSVSGLIGLTIGLIIEVTSTPWLLALILALIGLGCLFALIIRSRRRSDIPSVLKLN